jgi:hypothetical protein
VHGLSSNPFSVSEIQIHSFLPKTPWIGAR